MKRNTNIVKQLKMGLMECLEYRDIYFEKYTERCIIMKRYIVEN